MSGYFFKQLLITYAICFVILIAIALGSYVVAYDMYTDMCLGSNADSISSGLDAMADEIERFSLLASQQRTLSDYTRISKLAHPFEPRHLLWLEFARERLALSVESMALNDSVVDCALIYQNDACITLKRTFEDIDDFYGKYFYVQGMSLAQWRAMLVSSAESGRVMLPSQVAYVHKYGQFNALTLIQSAKYHYGTDITNVSYMVLDADAVLRSLVSPDVVQDCSITLYMYDEVLATLGHSAQGGMRALEASSLRMPGLKVYAEIPVAFINRQLRPLVALFAITLSAYLVLGIALTVWFSYRSSAPMRMLSKMLCQLRGSMPYPNEYNYIADEIGRMDGDLRRTHMQLEQREREVRAIMLERLLCGAPYQVQYSGRDMANALFREFPDEYCLCMMRTVDGCDASQPICEAVIDMLRGELGASLEPLTSGDTLLFVLPLGAGMPDSEQYRIKLNALCERALSELGMRAHVALSDRFDSANQLVAACNQVRQLIRIMPSDAPYTILRSDMTEHSYSQVEYTDSQRFYEALMAGDGEGALAMARSALDGVRRVSEGYAHIEQVFYAFQRVFDRIEFELKGCGIYANLKYVCNPLDTVDKLEGVLAENVNKAIEGISTSRKLRTRKFNESVMAYIDAHICDVELSARTVAEHFSLPEREIQALTRAADGLSFFEYVDNRRMARAHEQVLNTDLPVSQIAANCGFALANSFYKAFKRRFGVSPSALRASARAASDATGADVVTGQ